MYNFNEVKTQHLPYHKSPENINLERIRYNAAQKKLGYKKAKQDTVKAARSKKRANRKHRYRQDNSSMLIIPTLATR